MSITRTKRELGRNLLSARAGWKDVRSGVVFNDRSGETKRLLERPGVVTFSPYSRDGWRQLIRNHQDATTVMVGNRLKIKSQQYTFHETIVDIAGTRVQSWVGSGDLLATAGSVPTIIGGDPNAVARATEKFLKSMRDATHEMRGASVLAEAGEAVRMLASPAKALRNEVENLYQTARKRMYRDRNNSVRAIRDVVSGTWLEWNFGIRPLVSDANAAADALNQLRTRELQAIFPIRGSARDEKLISQATDVNFSSASVQPGNLSTIPGRFSGRIIDWQECTFRGALVLDPRPGADVPLSAQFGVGFNDVVPAIWEAIPWSWLFDYFFNTSAVIDAWSYPTRNVAWANRTVRNGRTHMYDNLKAGTNTYGPGKALHEYWVSGGNAEATLYNFSRSSISIDDLRVPLRLKLPGMGTQWANLAALASYGANLGALRRTLRGA